MILSHHPSPLRLRAFLQVFATLLCCLLVSTGRAQQPGTVDLTFNPGDPGLGIGYGANDPVAASIELPDGKILIGGGFTMYNGVARSRVARLLADGTLDASFDPGSGANGKVNCMVRQPDGKILIGGDFTTYAGTPRNRVARLNADGSLDASFDPGDGPSDEVFAMALQSSGRVLIGGDFNTVGGMAKNHLARLNTDGSVDASFMISTGTNSRVNAIVVQPDQRIVIGGEFSTYNSVQESHCARLNADGSLEPGFVTTDNHILALALQSDGRLVIGGRFTYCNSVPRNRIARVNVDGTVDTGFDPGTGVNNTVFSVLPQADGKILVGGTYSIFNGVARNSLVRLLANGSFDTGFDIGTGPYGSPINAFTALSGGRVLAHGNILGFNGRYCNGMVVLLGNGAVDQTFNPGKGVAGVVDALLPVADGKCLIAGRLYGYNGVSQQEVVRVLPNGDLDPGFQSGNFAPGVVHRMALQPDGKVVVACERYFHSSGNTRGIARLHANGSLDLPFLAAVGSGTNGTVSALALQPDGKVLIAGQFTSFNGITRNRIARLNADGTLDTSFDPGAGPNQGVMSMTVQPDGRILIGGEFFNYNGVPCEYIVRLNTDGTLDTGFTPGPGVSYSVGELLVQPDGKIIAAGAYSRLSRLHANGTRDTGFNGTVVNGAVGALALQPNGKILVGGSFTLFDAISVGGSIRLHPNGDLDCAFATPEVPVGGSTIEDVAIHSDGRIMIGGLFRSYNGTGRNGVARLYGGEVSTDPSATVGGPQTMCRGATTAPLGGNTPTFGTGTWSLHTGTLGTFSDASSPSSTFTAHPNSGGPLTLRWTISYDGCVLSFANVVITLTPPPSTATVGAAQTICAQGTTGVLNGSAPTAGTGAWSVVSGGTGTFSNALSRLSTFTHTGGAGPVVLRWTISNGSCTPSSADLSITITPPPTATVGTGQSICALSTTTMLGGNTPESGTGAWSIVSGGTGTFSNAASPSSTFTHTGGAGPVILRWTVTSGVCSNAADVSITLAPAPTTAAVGGSTSVCTGGTITSLSGNTAVVGTGAWSVVSGGTGTFGNANDPQSSFTHTGGVGPLMLHWTITNGSCTSTAVQSITISPAPTTATAGVAQTICAAGTTTALGGNTPVVGTGSWIVVSGGIGSFSNASSPSSTFTHMSGAGPVVLTWRIMNGPCASFANITITITPAPTPATVGAAQTICSSGTTTSLGGNTPTNGTGAWSIVSGGTGTFSNTTSPSSIFTHTGGVGPVVLHWTISNGSCSPSAADMNVIITPPPTTATVTGGQSVCTGATTTSLGGNTPVVGTGTWSIVTGGTGTFSDATSPSSTFTHTGGTGVITLRWTITNGTCTSLATKTVSVTPEPTTATVSGGQSICTTGTTVGLGGNTPIVGFGNWTVVSGGTGSFSGNTDPNATFTHTGGAGPVVLRWTIRVGTCTSTADVNITITPDPTAATVGAAQAICALGTTTGLGGNTPTNGTGAWSLVSGGTGTFSDATSPSSTFTHTGGAGTLVLRWTISNGSCASTSADVNITFTPPPTTATVTGGQSVCTGGTTTSLGGNTPVVGTGEWSITSGGTGTFSDATSPSSTFTHTSGTGVITLRWTITNGTCTSSATKTVSVTAEPTTATVGGGQSICTAGTTVGLSGNTPIVGFGNWTVVSGGTGSFSGNTDPNATFTHTGGAGPLVLRWTIRVGTCTSTADVNIIITSAPSWYADADGDGAGDPATMLQSCIQPDGHVPNNTDGCPADPNKQAPGACGCGVVDDAATYYTDTDGDGFGAGPAIPGFTCEPPAEAVTNNTDNCPADANKQTPGACGCGVADVAQNYYADTDDDGFGAGPAIPGFTCDPPAGTVTNNTDDCPTLTGVIGGTCDDNNANTVNDLITANCQCVGTPITTCTENVTVELRTDAFSSQASWQILEQDGSTIVCQFTIPVNGVTTPITENCCLPQGCYRLRVSDSGGDGFVNGGYQLRESGMNGRRIIDNFGNFSNGNESSLPTTYDNGAFCVPLGNDRPIFTSCDKLDWVPNQFIVATENATVSGQYNVSNATSGYEFWFFDPNGAYSFRRFRSHATTDGTGTGALRANHFRLNGWSNTVATPHLPANTLLNVRIRGRVAGNNLPFGPACLFKIDATRAACPLVKLQDNPLSTEYSCGIARTFGGANNATNKLVAAAPQFTPTVASTSVRYQFRFRLPGEYPNAGSCIVRPPQTSPTLYLNWTSGDKLKCNTQYQVDVRVSKDGGATWCIAGGEATCSQTPTVWGKVCNVNITTSTYCPSAAQGESSNMTTTGQGEFTMYPNPNRGDDLRINLTGIAPEVSTAYITIVDLTGKTVLMRTTAVQAGTLNGRFQLDELATGIYLVQVVAGEQRKTERLVLQR